VTLNPATCRGLERDVGGIAPGRFADLVLMDDLEQCRVREVLVGGRVVARDRRINGAKHYSGAAGEDFAFARRRNGDNIQDV
jgi:adenine deaminase